MAAEKKPERRKHRRRPDSRRKLSLDTLIDPPPGPRVSRAEKYGSAMSNVLRSWKGK